MFRYVATSTVPAAVFCALAVFTVPAQAQQFSADVVRTPAGQPSLAPGKVYASGSKLRIEIPETPNSYYLVDTGIPAGYFVRPAQHIFMDSKQSSALTRILGAVDANDPCPQWQMLADIAATSGHADPLRCDRIGEDVLDGRSVFVYRVTSSRDRQMVGWVDRQLHWPIRVKLDDGTVVDLRNIREQPQPAALFDLPSDFHKFDPHALIEQIKKSDVWVEPQQ